MAEDVLFRRIAAAVVVSLFAVSLYYRHRADKVGGRVTRDDEPAPIRLGLGVSGLMGFGGLLLYFFWPPALDWTLLPIPTGDSMGRCRLRDRVGRSRRGGCSAHSD